MSAASTTPSASAPTHSNARYRALGFIALTVAVVGLIFDLIPPAAIIGWLLTLAGLVLSIIAVFLKGRKWPAVVALIVSVLGILAGGLMLLAIAGVIG